jgi:hypothetical protein
MILLMMFLEVPSIRSIFSLIPFMKILVRLIFVAPALLVVLTPFCVISVLRADSHRHNQTPSQHNHFEVSIHDVLLLSFHATEWPFLGLGSWREYKIIQAPDAASRGLGGIVFLRKFKMNPKVRRRNPRRSESAETGSYSRFPCSR